jgi:hypothetical protein
LGTVNTTVVQFTGKMRDTQMRRIAIVLFALFLASPFVQSQSALAQSKPAQETVESPIGKVVTAEGTATIEHTGTVPLQAALPKGPIPAKVGELVYRGDVVQTAADGKVGLVFLDGTALNVLTNARMELNEYVFDANSKWNSSLFNLTKGAFTFVGGKMAKTGGLRVNTPTATMGIRGTSAHVIITEDGSVKFSTLVEEKQ